MVEITNQNFNEKYTEIISEISKSDFIAIDCEFSGLLRHKKNKLSLFDNPSERYDKLRKGNEDFVAFQIGITSFKYKKDEKYEAATYAFHLFPRNYSGEEAFFLCDARSVQFLCEQKFDFNKVFHDGITYINASNESILRREIDDGSLVTRVRVELNGTDREIIRSLCGQVWDWRKEAEMGETKALDVTGIEPFTVYLIREEIESRCRGVSTHSPIGGELLVELTNDSRQWDRRDEVFVLASGFTRLLKEVIAMKKPVIGHNMFTDLLVIYKMFIAPLPDNYEKFKKELNRTFPEVYDTKYLSFQLRKIFGKRDIWSTNALLYLYRYFAEERGTSASLPLPVVEYKSFCDAPRCENSHDSGFDSYCTGYIFLKMAHMYSMWDVAEESFKTISTGNGPIRYFDAVKSMRNKLNLMRGHLDYISLDGPDPTNERRKFILMESLAGTIDISRVSNAIAKYNNVDIKQLTKRRALIASSSEVSSKMIYKQFVKDRNYRVSKYNPDSQLNGTLAGRRAIALTLLGGIGLAYLLWYKKTGGVQTVWEPTGRVDS